MTAAPLRAPSASFFSQKLHLKRMHPSMLVRVSGHNTGEPYFGRSGANRFDDPDSGSPTRFGTCYFGDGLLVAVAETLLHEERPTNGAYYIASDRLDSLFVLSFSGWPLILADFTGAALKRLGLHAGLSGTASYKKTQRWSKAIHDHPAHVDGFIYMSRHLNTGRAFVLFDRAKPKIHLDGALPLLLHPEVRRVAIQLGIKSA
ncbi:RES family NAD+ phosphorylase [Massilia aquatica]|uniref:RES family NAD+ phosphorylase n=1 Tax=Massilia aquatica TaxID=2609000 RepID=A0ABX0MF55_9BURK|nr:RES family NAD+ phosphorylase [Massilia aquatica]NHZ40746.1 RES family NAD+ phosphorylase [Massilia aquatica]